MKIRRFEWSDWTVAKEVRYWSLEAMPEVDVTEIQNTILESEDVDGALLELTARFDATEVPPRSLAVAPAEMEQALSRIDADLRSSLEVAAVNIRTVAEKQVTAEPLVVKLPQGQVVTIREVPMRSAGIYAPGGRAAYPSSVLMCAIPARVAGVERIALATPPGPEGKVNTSVLAAAALCEVDEVYALGGAQAIFALAYGSQTIENVDAIAGPGNAWVRGAKMAVSGIVAIDSLAGPSELMVVVDDSVDPRWVAFDLCAQAEHGSETPLVVVATEDAVLDRVAEEAERLSSSRSGVGEAPLALIRVPDLGCAVDFANAFVPEHLQLMVSDENIKSMVPWIYTAGCVLTGHHSATSFGDYVAGSNHVLPTSGAGRFSGPLGPGTFRRKLSIVEVSPGAAAKLAPHVETIARAEGFPVHGESAMIRAEEGA